MNTFSKLYLALLGLFPWDYVPTIPCEVILIGKWFYVNFNEMSSWSRSMLVPLWPSSIISSQPARSRTTLISTSFIPRASIERDLVLPRDPERFTWRNFFLWLDQLHKFAEWFAEHNIHPFRKRALKKAEQWMLERFEGTDGLAAIFPAMLNSLIASRPWVIPTITRKSSAPAKRLKELRARNRKQRPHRALLLPGLGHGHYGDRAARVRPAPAITPRLKKAADWLIDQRNPVSRRLALQESRQRRAQRLGFRVQQQVESGRR